MKHTDDLERRLREIPVPDPPEDLAERIIAEIPEELSAAGGPASSGRGSRSQWWMAAAAVLVLALTGVVTWKMGPLGHSGRESKLILVHTQSLPEVPAAGTEDMESTSAPVRSPNGRPGEASPIFPTVATSRTKSGKPTAEVSQTQPAPVAQPDRSTAPVPMAGADREEAPVTSKAPAVGYPSASAGAGTVADGTGRSPIAGGGKGASTAIAREPVPRPEKMQLAPKPRAPATGEAKSDIYGPQDEIAILEGQADQLQALGQTREATDLLRQVAQLRGAPEGAAAPSTGGNAEPNDQPYGDVFFDPTGVNPFVDTEDDRLSTFGLDVDTGSYTITRRYLRDGHLPPPSAIRVEEFVNAFDYDDPAPRRNDFLLMAEGAPNPFGGRERSYILRFAVTARQVDAADRPPALLIFTVDVSGSMARENRLGLVKRALAALLDELRSDDRVGLVVYGSNGRVLLEPTRDHEAIRRAIERLQPGGSTNVEEGLVLAYRMADRFRNELEEEEGARRPIVRVILCSDGVANVGRTGAGSILERIRQEAGKGVELTTVGFGMGNYNDTLMERLADTGDGRYAYVDDFEEAHRIFVEELMGTLLTIAHDARSQVEFDPRAVQRWRLLGYENRDIADERFRDPTVDAGEVGAGQTVTALYEVKLRPRIPSHRVVATLRLRYRPTGKQGFVEIKRLLRARDLARSWEEASPRLQLASLVAEFAEILKHSYWAKHDSLGDVLLRLRRLRGPLSQQQRVQELENLVREALMAQRNKRGGE